MRHARLGPHESRRKQPWKPFAYFSKALDVTHRLRFETFKFRHFQSITDDVPRRIERSLFVTFPSQPRETQHKVITRSPRRSFSLGAMIVACTNVKSTIGQRGTLPLSNQISRTCFSFQLPQPPPPPEEMRTPNRSMGSKVKEMLPPGTQGDVPPFNLPPPPPPPQLVLTSTGCRDCDADKLAQRFDRMGLNNATNNGRPPQGFTDHTRSFSAGRLNAIKRDGNGSNGTSTPKLLPKPMTRQLSFQDNDTCLPTRSKGSFTNVAAGVLIGGVLTQWNAGPDCWDWGMGWGWTGWNAAFCGTCAMEQAVLANHGILQPHLTNAPPSIDTSGPGPQGGGHAGDSNAHFYFDDDPDIGELGEADVDCDFGDFGF